MTPAWRGNVIEFQDVQGSRPRRRHAQLIAAIYARKSTDQHIADEERGSHQ